MTLRKFNPKIYIKMTTPDGSVIMDRTSSSECFMTSWGINREFIDHSLALDALLKGVKILGTVLTEDGISAVVDFLSTKVKK